jgi:HD-GYP domain-containing protein (c-di-GMP phosphodiesterase class II)
MGKKLGYSKDRLKILGLGAFLHDIGKAKVSTRILNKPGELTDEEFAKVKKHTKYGYEVLTNIDNIPERAARVAYGHHERCDGSGYPKGITKRFISHYSRIVTVVDVFDSMINKRVYRDPIHIREVIEYLYTRFTKNEMDREIIEQFLEIVTPYPVGTKIKLSTGQQAVVTKINTTNNLRPVVKILPEGGSTEIDLNENLDVQIEEVLS